MPDLLGQIPSDVPVEIVVGNGAYDTKHAHAVIAAIANGGRLGRKKFSGYNWRSLVESLMCWHKTLAGNRRGRDTSVRRQTDVAIRVGLLNRMTALACPQSVRIA